MLARILTPLALAAAVVAPAPRAGADVIISYVSDEAFEYDVTYMPDFDQRRDFLPGDGGMYCVPTSSLDVSAFLARHGYPQVVPGSQSYWHWASQQSYGEVDGLLFGMGIWMGTSASDGTYSNGWQNGLAFSGVTMGNGLLRVYQSGNRRHWQDIADWALFGAIVMPVVGWYPDLELTARDGGHVMALTEMTRVFGNRTMGFRDPAGDEGDVPGRLTMQSPFMTNMSDVVDTQVNLCCFNLVTMNKLVGYSSDTTLGLLDGFTAIVPLNGLTASPDHVNLQLFRPESFDWDALTGLTEFPFGFQGPIVGLDFAPNTPDFFVATEAGVWRVDPISGAEDQLVAADGLVDIAFGRVPRLYTLSDDGRVVTCYDITGDLPVEEASSLIPSSHALVYDDTTDQIIAFSADILQLTLLPKDLSGEPVAVPVPQLFVGGQVYMTVSPADGRIWIGSEGTSRMYLIRLVAGAPPIVELHEGLVGDGGGPMQVNDEGHLLVSVDGFVKEFKEEGETWVSVDDSPFAGWQVGSCFALMRSRSDFEPGIHDGPEYRNVLPEFTPEGDPDCVGDVNVDDVVNVVDLLAVLNAWGGADVDADQSPIGGDGIVNVLDLLVVIGNWGPCP